MRINSFKLIPIFIIGVLGVLGVVGIVISTPHSIGTSPDSIGYLKAADNLLSGHGLTTSEFPGVYQPLTQYPPLYSIVLAAGGWFIGDTLQAARIIAGTIFGLNILIVGLLLYTSIRSTIWPAMIGSGVMLVASPMINVHVMAWSEPLFILLCLLSLLALSAFFAKGKFALLLVAAVLTSLAALTRYAGMALVLTQLIGILFYSKGNWVKRVREIFIFGFISVLPLLAYLLYNQRVSGSATNRILSFHPVTLPQIGLGIRTVSAWFGLPAALPIESILIGTGLILALIVFVMIKQPKPEQVNSVGNPYNASPTRIFSLLAIFTGVYGLFLLFSISFLDANTELDGRILSPIYVTILILIIDRTTRFLYPLKASIWKLVATIPIGLILVNYLIGTVSTLSSNRFYGIGFSTPVWRDSPLIEEIQTLPADTLIYTNIPEGIYLHTGRPAARLPRKFFLSSQEVNLQFESEISQIGRQLVTGQSVIAFSNFPDRSENPSLQDIQEVIHLSRVVEVADGSIYSASQDGAFGP